MAADPYRIEFKPSAAKALKESEPDVQRRLAAKLDALATVPRPRGVEKLSGFGEDFHRIRVGDYRIVYQVFDERLLILVVRIAHRREVYR